MLLERRPPLLLAKLLLKRPVLWLFGALGGGIGLIDLRGMALSPLEVAWEFARLSVLLAPLVAWLGHRAVSMDRDQEALQAAPRPLFTRTFITAVFISTIAGLLLLGGLTLAGLTLGLLGKLGQGAGDARSFLVLLFGWAGLFFWSALGAAIANRRRSWVTLLVVVGSLWVGTWIFPVLLVQTVMPSLAPWVLRLSPLSPAYPPLFPHSEPGPLLPWGPVPEWALVNRLFLVGVGILLVALTSGHAVPSRGQLLAGAIGAVATAVALGILVNSWPNRIAPFTLVDLLKGKAQLDRPYTYDAYGRTLVLRGRFGTLFVDARPPDAPPPPWLQDQPAQHSSLAPLKAGLIGFLPPSEPDPLPPELERALQTLKVVLSRAFWVPSVRVFIGPQGIGGGLLPASPHLNASRFYLWSFEERGAILLSEAFLRWPEGDPQRLSKLIRLARQLALKLETHRPGRIYAALYLLEPLFPEANSAYRRKLQALVQTELPEVRAQYRPLPLSARPTPAERETFRRLLAQNVGFPESLETEADIVWLLREREYADLREAAVEAALRREAPQLQRVYRQAVERARAQLFRRLAPSYGSGRATEIVRTLVEQLQEEGTPLAEALQLQADEGLQLLNERLSRLEEELSRQLGRRLVEQLGLSSEEARGLVRAFMTSLKAELQAERERSTKGEGEGAEDGSVPSRFDIDWGPYSILGLPTRYEAWLVLQYWEEGERRGHREVLRAALRWGQEQKGRGQP